MVWRAAAALQDGLSSAAAHVSHAKLAASDAALLTAETAIQVHGAMGYTYEVDLHFWMKRSWALAGAPALSILGLRLHAHELRLVPCLPRHWPRAELNLERGGRRMRFVLVRGSPAQALAACGDRDARLLGVGESFAWRDLPDFPEEDILPPAFAAWFAARGWSPRPHQLALAQTDPFAGKYQTLAQALPVAVPGTNTCTVVTVLAPGLSVPKLTGICTPVLKVTVPMTVLAVPAPMLLTVTVALTVVPGCALAGRSKVTETSATVMVTVVVERLLVGRSEEHTSELQSRKLISYDVFCL